MIKFGPLIAAHLRRRRSHPTSRWHLDDMVVKIGGQRMYLWRAVDDEGEVLGIVNRTVQVPAFFTCITGAVIAIFWPAGCCATGAVMAMAWRRVLPPKMYLASRRKPLVAAAFCSPVTMTSATIKPR